MTERKTAQNGIGIFPWNRFSRRYHLVNRDPFSRITDRRRPPGRQCGKGVGRPRRSYRGSYMGLMRDGLWVAKFDGDSVQTVRKTSVERFAQAA
ncbi:hypothetical protein EMIT0111MI5_60139 [Burkholderia sp. IT-111MI5]